MGFDEDKILATHDVEGAIFMSNRATKKECLRRKLFGLPPSQETFVKQIKTGMIMFLFEYEERKLYGVFEATSDGAMNIEPHAFRSLGGKTFPAQIRFKSIWSCYPLSEHDFHNAIQDNYYTHNKFHFYLSEEQVCHLIQLFSSKKIRVQHSRSLGTGSKSINRSRSFGMTRTRVTDKGRFLTTDSVENEPNIDSDREPSNFIRYSDLSNPDVNNSGNNDKQILNRDLSAIDREKELPLTVPSSSELRLSGFRSSLTQNDVTNNFLGGPLRYSAHYPLRPNFQHAEPSFSLGKDHSSNSAYYSQSSIDKLFPYPRTHLGQSQLERDTLNLSSARYQSQDVSTYPEDYIPLPPSPEHYEPSNPSFRFPGPEYFEKKWIGSSATAPLFRDESLGNKSVDPLSFASGPGKAPSHACDYSFPAQSQHGDAREALGFGNKIVDPLSFFSPRKGSLDVREYIHPIESQYMKRYEGMPHYHPMRNDKYYPPTINSKLQSDIDNKRTSVFSRLTVAPEANSQDDDSYESDEDISVSELMEILTQRRTGWKRNIVKKSNSWNVRVDDKHIVDVGQMEMSGADALHDEDLWGEGQMDEESCKIPFLNFKRRSEIRKMRSEAETKNCLEGENSQGSLGKNMKRKLIRPVIDRVESLSNCNSDDHNKQGLSPKCTNFQKSVGECKGNTGGELSIKFHLVGASDGNFKCEGNTNGLPEKVGNECGGNTNGSSEEVSNKYEGNTEGLSVGNVKHEGNMKGLHEEVGNKFEVSMKGLPEEIGDACEVNMKGLSEEVGNKCEVNAKGLSGEVGNRCEGNTKGLSEGVGNKCEGNSKGLSEEVGNKNMALVDINTEGRGKKLGGGEEENEICSDSSAGMHEVKAEDYISLEL
ncbi:DCD (Development and Cell Death) domain protein isoform X2 [Tasmannia lanceolata]